MKEEKNEVLAFFDRYAQRDRLIALFSPSFWLTREQYANRLSIGRTTIWRWEESIIKLVYPLIGEYRGEFTHPFLDNYQRFILSIVYSLKNGLLVEGKYMTNEEVKGYLKTKQDGLTRGQFTKWIQGVINDHTPTAK